MKDKELIEKLRKYGSNFKTLFILLGVLVVVYGVVIGARTTDVGISEVSNMVIILVYLVYAIVLAIAGVITELIFNWMASVLKNLSKGKE